MLSIAHLRVAAGRMAAITSCNLCVLLTRNQIRLAEALSSQQQPGQLRHRHLLILRLPARALLPELAVLPAAMASWLRRSVLVSVSVFRQPVSTRLGGRRGQWMAVHTWA